MIIDFHTHTFPDKVAVKAIPKLEKSASIKAFTDGTVNGLVDSMNENGIDFSVVVPVVTNPVKAEEINEYAAETNQTHKNVISFGGIHPDTENYKAVLKKAQGLGLKGIKLHPEFQYTDFDDIRYKRILYFAEELGLITLVHAGFDGSFPDSMHCGIKNILNVIEEIGPKRLVLAHMGGCFLWKDVKKYIAGADVYFDTAFSFGKKQIVSGLLSEEEFIVLARAHGMEKILFGTDSPWGEQGEMSEFIKNSALTDGEKENILYKNALKLLSD
ncbi:MAG: amidohydrolase family protein [Clostridiales bacterium]|nr:amidohydrolase family protein [Clostridiales bacterium]